MSLMMLLGAGALLLLLVALLVLQRRRAAARSEGDAGVAAGSAEAATDDDGEWRDPGLGDRAIMLLRGRRAGLALLRHGADEIRVRRDRGAVCLANHHDSVYGGRPDWDHVSALTLAMGKAERCFPGADLSGRLRYVDKTVPLEYSPRLVADLEDDTAPDPRDGAATG